MPVTEKKQIDVFAIIILILLILILVFLIISAVYYINISNFIYPSQSQSLFLFWTTIILCIIVFGMIIFAFYKIYTHKSIVFDAEKHIVVSPPKYTTKSYSQNTIQVKKLQQPPNNLPKNIVKVESINAPMAIVENDNDTDLEL
jgi:uncharacterized membrane protein (DUF106 family)